MKYGKFTSLLIFLFVFVLSASICYADTNVFYRGQRPMSMGGAFVAVGDDYNSYNWNPAALATIDENFIGLEIVTRISKDIGDEAIKSVQGEGLINDTADALSNFEDNSSEGVDMTDTATQEMYNIIDEISSKIIEATPELYAGFTIRPWKFAFGVSSIATVRTYIIQSSMSDNPFFPKAYSWIDNKVVYNVKWDTVPTISKAFTIKEVIPTPEFLSEGDHTDRDLHWGFNFKYLNRMKYDNENDPISFTDLADPDKLAENKSLPTDTSTVPTGTGMALDVGSIVKVNKYLNLGLSIQDIGISKITYNNTDTFSTADEEFKPNIRIGTALKPLRLMDMESKYWDMTLAADLDNLNNEVRDHTDDFMDKTHIGLENRFTLWNDFLGLGLRVGANQGFPTYGFTINTLWLFSLQATMYGDEITDYYTVTGGMIF